MRDNHLIGIELDVSNGHFQRYDQYVVYHAAYLLDMCGQILRKLLKSLIDYSITGN